MKHKYQPLNSSYSSQIIFLHDAYISLSVVPLPGIDKKFSQLDSQIIFFEKKTFILFLTFVHVYIFQFDYNNKLDYLSLYFEEIRTFVQLIV